ncbi:MAG TPA: DUF3667 domain-containing protein [Phaeodactylibacter sp.]|nr:DUF3667 domain-containing protein [Phaeodactylibacter sp.]
MQDSNNPPQRISMKYLANELMLALNLEKGLGYTLWQWLVHPKRATQEFLYEDRRRMIKPIGLLALVLAVATYVSLKVLPLGEPLWEDVKQDLPTEMLTEEMLQILQFLIIGMKKYFNLFFALSLPGQAIATYLLYQQSGYNLAEQLVINTYIFCVQTVLYVLIIPFLGLTENVVGVLFLLSWLAYWFYALWRIFGKSVGQTLLRLLGIFLLMQVISQFILSIGMLLYGLWLSL